MKKSMRIAIVGATGVVGQMFCKVLEERNIAVEKLIPFASNRSVGQTILFKGQDIPVIELTEENIKNHPVDFVLMSAGGDVALKFAPLFASLKSIVIDNSSAFRMHKNVPLVVPEVNPQDALNHQYIIANPNCSTIQAVVAIKPLHDAFILKRMVISTYQAVSGAGSKGINDFIHNHSIGQLEKFPYPIVGNVIPQIDIFLPSGNTKEEEKIIFETRKIMNLPQLKISSTAVRVPVLNSHSESINLEFERPVDIEKVLQILRQSPGIKVVDNPSILEYPMPLMVSGHDEVYIGRIRLDTSVPSGINMFVVADNIRKGAATNAVQILEYLINKFN
jgi:aspartate-semialdehyde dehydrogenase